MESLNYSAKSKFEPTPNQCTCFWGTSKNCKVHGDDADEKQSFTAEATSWYCRNCGEQPCICP